MALFIHVRNLSRISNCFFQLFSSSAIPSVTLTLNSQDYLNDSLTFVIGEEIVAVCSASSGRPRLELTWLIDNTTLDGSTPNVSTSTFSSNVHNETFDVTSMLSLEVNNAVNGTITCVVSHSYYYEEMIANYVILGNFHKMYFSYNEEIAS